MEEIRNKRFRVDKIVYFNRDSKWGVLGTTPLESLGEVEYSLRNDFGSVGMSGNFEGVFEGCEIEVTGNIVTNPRYGKQIQIIILKVIQDLRNKESIINFLSKSVIKGISIQNAKKIYDKYKDKAIDTVLNNPDKLIEINGIGEKTVNKVKDSVQYYKSIEDLVKFGTEVGLSYYIINKLHEELGDSALEIIKEDPFKILDITQVISFKQVDEIYLKCNGNPHSKRRLQTGLLYMLKQLVTLEGSTGCKMSLLKDKFFKLLNLDESENFFKKLILSLEDEDKIYIDKDKSIIYYKEFLEIEKNISEKIKALNTLGIKGDKIRESIVTDEIKSFPFELNEKQIEAINKCLDSNVAVLTGSAGCITGDSLIRVSIGGSSKLLPIKELFIKFKSRNKLQKVYVKSYIEKKDFLRMNEIEDVVHSGKKEVYKLTLENNSYIKATATHEIMTERGFVDLQDLKDSDYVMINENARNKVPQYSKVKSVEYVGIEDTFDICCYKDHNFIANGIVVHNSGKTTITKALYRIYSRCGFNVDLLSPTAKACRRLEECTGGFAQTIHKFLGMKNDGSVEEGKRSVENSVFIIDEASMMDIILFNHLLKRTTLTSRVLLVGDNNQLPSVQAGNVLGDLIDSDKVTTAKLVEVMRQKDDSNIIRYCNEINKGIVFDPTELKDFHYEEFGTGEELLEFFIEKYLEEVKEHGLNEVQVITPYKKGELGMNNLNLALQSAYNENGKKLLEPYRIGDRVRHTQNNYKKDVYNGETGVITGVTEDEDIIVDYGNKVIYYDNTDIEELTLSYCSTVHASQGSEYETCFVILDDTAVNNFLFIRRLLYTAVSRGKKKVYILTKPYLVDQCIENDNYKPRITKLKEFLKD